MIIRNLSAVLALSSLTAALLHAQDAPDPPQPLMAAMESSNGLLLPLGAPASLTLRVTARDGSPLAGASVLFVAPVDGPSGSFPDADPADQSVLRVATDNSGLATAAFVANDVSGGYLVEGLLEGGASAVTFAVTNTDASSLLDPAIARAAVKRQLLNNALEDENLRVYGPVLIRAGAMVAAADPAFQIFPTSPYLADRDLWLFWIDQAPRTLFGHLSRFVLMDANDISPDLARKGRVSYEGWWPVVYPPDPNPSFALRPASELNPAFGPAPVTPPGPTAALVRFFPPPPAAEDNACAIVLYGSDEGAMARAAGRLTGFFGMRVPDGNVFSGRDDVGNFHPSSGQTLRMDVEEARKRGCKHLYLALMAHSFGNGLNMSDGFMSWQTLGDILEPLGLDGATVSIVLISCYSGNAIGALQGKHFDGEIITSSDTESMTWYHPLFQTFDQALTDYWTSDRSLADAGVYVQIKGGWTATWGNPQYDTIRGSGLQYPVQPAYVPKAGGGGEIVINPIPDIKTDTGITVTIEDVNDGFHATFADGTTRTTKVLKAGQPLHIPVTAIKDGRDLYSVQVIGDANRTYNGGSIIQVGSGYAVEPNPLKLVRGTTGQATLMRYGALRQNPRQTPLTVVSDHPEIAAPGSATLTFNPGEKEKMFPVGGISKGTATFTVTDTLTGLSTSFQVIVEDPAPPPAPKTACLDNSSYNGVFMVAMDPAGHDPFVALRSSVLTLGVNGTAVTISGSAPQTVKATGTAVADPTQCAFSAAGTGVIAGRSNVKCEYRNITITRSGNTTMLKGQYALGTGGELPTGQAIVYNVTGTMR
jgi:hypothetical protein